MRSVLNIYDRKKGCVVLCLGDIGRVWRVKEGFMKEVVFEQGFIGQVGFLEINIRGRRKSDG